MQEAHTMPLTSASLSLLQKGHRKRGFDHVASYVAKQAAYPPGDSGDGSVRADNPASPRNSSIILLGEETGGLSQSAARNRVQPEGTRLKCNGESDESPGAALLLDARKVSRKCQRYDSSLISPIKENNAEDGIRYGSETTFASWPTSPAREPAEISQRTAARKEVFERRKRYKMRETRQKSAIEKTKRKKERHKKKREDRTQKPRMPQPAFGVLASSVVESEHLSGARLTVRPQIATGIFHKGRVSGLRSRAALPDLTFCEMDFLQSASEFRPAQEIGDGGRDKNKKRVGLDANEEMSSFFKKTTPASRKENKGPLLAEATTHAAPSKMQDKSVQADCPEMACRPNSLSLEDHRSTNTQHLIETAVDRVNSSFSGQYPRRHTALTTPTSSRSNLEQIILGSLSVNRSESSDTHSQTISSKTSNPIMAWLRTTSRDCTNDVEDGIRDKRSHIASSVREFNGISSSSNPPAAKHPINPPQSPHVPDRKERDPSAGKGLSIHPENMITGEAIPITHSQIEAEIIPCETMIYQKPLRHFSPNGETFGGPVHSLLRETEVQSHIRTDNELRDGSASDYNTKDRRNGDVANAFGYLQPNSHDILTSRDRHTDEPEESINWGVQGDRRQYSLIHPQPWARGVGTTSPYSNNRDLLVERSDNPTIHQLRYHGEVQDVYESWKPMAPQLDTNFDADSQNNESGLDDVETAKRNQEFELENYQRYQQQYQPHRRGHYRQQEQHLQYPDQYYQYQNKYHPPQNQYHQSQLMQPQLMTDGEFEPKNFWKPHRLY